MKRPLIILAGAAVIAALVIGLIQTAGGEDAPDRRVPSRFAFLGVATQDAEAPAAEFLAERPVPFPSYLDFDGKIAREDIGSIGTPSTLYYNAKGRRTFLHQGPYFEDADLIRDIERYTGA